MAMHEQDVQLVTPAHHGIARRLDAIDVDLHTLSMIQHLISHLLVSRSRLRTLELIACWLEFHCLGWRVWTRGVQVFKFKRMSISCSLDEKTFI